MPQPAVEARAADNKVITMPPRAEQPAAPAPAPPPIAAPPAARPRDDGPLAPASPSVRRLAREIGVDVNDVQGTGADGRITQDDVKEHARRILSSVPASAFGAGGVAGAAAGGAARALRPLPDFQKWGEV